MEGGALRKSVVELWYFDIFKDMEKLLFLER